MLTQALIDDYLRHLANDLRRAPSTVRGYRDELTVLLDRGVELDAGPLSAHLTTQQNGTPLAANTRNRRLAILRGFCRYLRERGHLPEDPLTTVRRSRVPRRRREALTANQVNAVVHALLSESPSWRRTRDGTILLLFFYTGLRLSELVRLDVDQVDLAAGVLRQALRKGGDATDVVLHPCLVAQLALWLRVRFAAVVGGGALFPRGNSGRLSGRMVQKRLRYLCQAAGLGISLHPHLLRHAHATGLLREGVTTAIIQLSMNHHALATTETYLHADAGLLRAAIARLPPLPLVPPPAPPESTTDPV